MKYVDYCVCCNSKNLESFSAMTVPFLVARMSG